MPTTPQRTHQSCSCMQRHSSKETYPLSEEDWWIKMVLLLGMQYNQTKTTRWTFTCTNSHQQSSQWTTMEVSLWPSTTGKPCPTAPLQTFLAGTWNRLHPRTTLLIDKQWMYKWMCPTDPCWNCLNWYPQHWWVYQSSPPSPQIQDNSQWTNISPFGSWSPDPRLQKLAWMYINFPIGQTLRDLQVPCQALPTTQRQNQKPTGRYTSYPKWQQYSQTLDLDDGTFCNPYPHLWPLENNWSLLLEKDAGNPQINHLCTIHLYKADYNLLLKWFSSKGFILNSRKAHQITDHQGRGCPGRSAIDLAITRVLAYKITETLQLQVIIVDNNTTACFDQMLEVPNNLACLQHGADPMYDKQHAQTQCELW